MSSFHLVVFIIGVALIFDYINGFHDAANSIATVVSTRVLTPRIAVIWAAAGHPNGFTTSLATENIQEIPELAQIVAQSAAAIGVKINLNIELQSKYYGNFEFGGSDWLDATMSLVDYGHRGVPNVFLTAPLQTTNSKTGTGPWNAAHFANSQYDKLVAQYIAAPDLSIFAHNLGKL